MSESQKPESPKLETAEPEPTGNNKADPVPPPFTPEYHKARRQLLLWSAILFGWALIGFDLEKLKKSEGNLGSFLESLKSPEAIPWVILILVFFFLYRYLVEWFQCDRERRFMPVSRFDLKASLGIPASAILLYFGQLFWDFRLADNLGEESGLFRYFMVLSGIVFFFAGYMSFNFRYIREFGDLRPVNFPIKWSPHLSFALSSFAIVYILKVAITSSFVRNVTELALILLATIILAAGMFFSTRKFVFNRIERIRKAEESERAVRNRFRSRRHAYRG